jgi:hypothetical protein
MAVSGSSVGDCAPGLGGPSYQASVLLSLDAVMCCAAVCHHKYMEMPSCWPLRVHSSRLIPPSGPVRPAFAFISCLCEAAFRLVLGHRAKKLFTLLDLCVSSLRRGHANLLCIVPILTDDPRRESNSMRIVRQPVAMQCVHPSMAGARPMRTNRGPHGPIGHRCAGCVRHSPLFSGHELPWLLRACRSHPCGRGNSAISDA